MGLTTLGADTYMLTWKSQKILKFSMGNLLSPPEQQAAQQPEVLDLPKSMKQGWGLSHDSRGKLYVSDGSDQIQVIESKTMETVDRIRVRD